MSGCFGDVLDVWVELFAWEAGDLRFFAVLLWGAEESESTGGSSLVTFDASVAVEGTSSCLLALDGAACLLEGLDFAAVFLGGMVMPRTCNARHVGKRLVRVYRIHITAKILTTQVSYILYP